MASPVFFKAMSRTADLITAKFNEWRQWFITFFVFLTSAFSANNFSILTEVPVQVTGMITYSGSRSFRSSFIELYKIMQDLCILRYAWIRALQKIGYAVSLWCPF